MESLSAMADDSAAGAAPSMGEPVTGKRLKMENQRPGTRCWACEVKLGSVVNVKKDPHSGMLLAMHEKMKPSCTDAFIYEELSRYQMRVILPWKRKAGQPCLSWTPDMVRTHFEAHVVSERDEIRRDIDSLRFAASEIESMIIREVEGGERVVDHKAAETYLKFLKQKQQLLSLEGSRSLR